MCTVIYASRVTRRDAFAGPVVIFDYELHVYASESCRVIIWLRWRLGITIYTINKNYRNLRTHRMYLEGRNLNEKRKSGIASRSAIRSRLVQVIAYFWIIIVIIII